MSLLGMGKGRGDGTPLPTRDEIIHVNEQGVKLLIPPARQTCLHTRVCLLRDASTSSSPSKRLAGFHAKPGTDCLSEAGASDEQG